MLVLDLAWVLVRGLLSLLVWGLKLGRVLDLASVLVLAFEPVLGLPLELGLGIGQVQVPVAMLVLGQDLRSEQVLVLPWVLALDLQSVLVLVPV